MMRTRNYQFIDDGRFLRAVWPPSRRWLMAQAMLSAIADRIGMRDGVLIVDRMAGGGFTGSYHVDIGLIRAGSEEENVRWFVEQTDDLGYEPARHPGMSWTYQGTTTVCRFERTHVMPDPVIATVSPGGSVFGTLLVPPGATGIQAEVGEGYTLTDGHHSLKNPNDGTAARMADLGIDITPPPHWRRFWFWWWIRGWQRGRLAWAAWRLGAYRGRVLSNWFIGGDAIGPYSFGIATLRRGDGRQLIAQIAARADALRFTRGHGLAKSTDIPGAAQSGRMRVSAITYPPGSKFSDSTKPVPPGFTAIIVSVTAVR